jgi:hypothetical protein
VPVLATDRDAHVTVPEPVGQERHQARAVLEQTEDLPRAIALAELRLSEDVLDPVVVHVARASRVVLLDETGQSSRELGRHARRGRAVAAHPRGAGPREIVAQ